MKAHSTPSGSEMLLVGLAIRLPALPLAGSILLLLPQEPRHSEIASVDPFVAKVDSQVGSKRERLHVGDAALNDMLLHD
jgi:hypothetical protein